MAAEHHVRPADSHQAHVRQPTIHPTLPPNHLIRTIGQDMPNRSPHRSDNVRTGA
jgi:hypothetical protein